MFKFVEVTFIHFLSLFDIPNSKLLEFRKFKIEMYLSWERSEMPGSSTSSSSSSSSSSSTLKFNLERKLWFRSVFTAEITIVSTTKLFLSLNWKIEIDGSKQNVENGFWLGFRIWNWWFVTKTFFATIYKSKLPFTTTFFTQNLVSTNQICAKFLK